MLGKVRSAVDPETPNHLSLASHVSCARIFDVFRCLSKSGCSPCSVFDAFPMRQDTRRQKTAETVNLNS
jgi:hypothetical protein